MDLDINIRKFEWGDLESVVRLVNRISSIEGTEREFDAGLMRQTLAHPTVFPETNFSLAVYESDPVGYYWLSPEVPISRAVVSGGVLSDYRSGGIGRRLLRAAVDQTASLGVEVLHIQTGASSNDARRLLESEDFHKVKDYWHMRWEGTDLPQLRLRSNFNLKSFRLGQDEPALTELQNAAFGEHWGFCPNTVEQIAARVRIRTSDPEGIIFVMDGDRPAGYNWTLRHENSYGNVGIVSMTGVHPDYRGNGLGTAVVVSGMRYLNEQGVESIELEVDAENTPARELYLKLGFRQVRHSVWYERRF